jgi:FtsP/CotA-like multicopper oxidase with cupredoxin domain
MGLNRRELLKLGLFGSAALMLPAERVARTQLAIADRIPASRLPRPFTVPFTVPPVLAPAFSDATTDFYDITQRQVSAEVLPGLRTDLWGYNGIVPGPTIIARKDRPTVVRQRNALPDVHPTLRYTPYTSTHLHGSPSLPQYDGYASDVTNPGQFKDYRYPNAHEASTMWYHDHGVHITAPNAYMGLAAFYLLRDEVEDALPIPHGRYDIPVMIRDALFTKSGQLIFDDRGESSLFGDVILVNGRPWPTMRVERRKYRFRLLNGSLSRSYRWALSTGEPLTLIATDGGLMPTPQQTATLRHGAAERYSIVIDFAKYRIGQRVVLRNLSLPDNVDFDTTGVAMAFDVVSDATDTTDNEVPPVLNPESPVMQLQPATAVRRRLLDFERQGGEWTVSRQTWADVVASGFREVVADPAVGDVEIWELRNKSGGWFHPVHIHLIDFRILDRNGRPPFAFERGPKDTAYVGENETVRVIARFGPHAGRYMIHCHNVVHEDHDMMVQFEVGAGGPDPLGADPARDLPAPPLRLSRPPASPPAGAAPGGADPPAPPAGSGTAEGAGQGPRRSGSGGGRGGSGGSGSSGSGGSSGGNGGSGGSG